MNSFISRTVWQFWFAIIVCAFPFALRAQDQTPANTQVSLGNVSGAPKAQVMIPVFLTPVPASTQVGDVAATLTFDGKDVTFVKAEKSFLLDGVGATFEVKAVPADDSGKAILNLQVATKGEPRRALREGLILTLVFRINEKANAPETVKVNVENVSANTIDNPAKPIQPLLSKNGTIEVVKPESVPYVGCFFFSH
jgi:hypothetical protein